jgi:hypothetical protein
MTLFFGILLALACALATNVGFLYKHRGACAAAPVDMRHPLRSGRSLFASPMFAIGMLIAAGAWIFHVAAMSMAPLSIRSCSPGASCCWRSWPSGCSA